MDHHHHHHSQTEADDAAMAELLDLDAEVLHDHHTEVADWIGELAADRPPAVLLDLGSGTGTGTFALLRRFERAQAVALDTSAHLLAHLTRRARERGFADRIRTVRADLDETWPPLGPLDLVWASASMHHLADPDAVLTALHGALRPGGLLVVAEPDGLPFPRLLPDDAGVGRPGLEARIHSVLAEARATDMPHLGSDWGPRLTRAGFTIEAERPFTIDLEPPLPPATGPYAQATLHRLRTHLTDRLPPEDLTALDTLTAPDTPQSVLHRPDLTVHTTRRIWTTRRP